MECESIRRSDDVRVEAARAELRERHGGDVEGRDYQRFCPSGRYGHVVVMTRGYPH